MSVKLSDLLAELPEINKNPATGTITNTKRTRALNWVIQDMQSFADWDPTRRTAEFEFIGGINEYSLKNYLKTTCYDNDGATEISDFKSPFDLRHAEDAISPFQFRDVKDVRSHILNGKLINEYGIDNDLLVINYPDPVSSLIHGCNSLTADGTWAASGDASNLTIDDEIYSEGAGALNFDVSAGVSLVLTLTGFTALDLSSFLNKGVLTLDAWLPTISGFSSIAVKWGSSASDYWSKTETARIDEKDLVANQKTKFAFKWKDATPTGSPDSEAIDYLQITITFSAAITDTDFRIDDIRMAGIEDMEFEYYSLAFVKTAAGDYQKEFNADSPTQTNELIGGDQLRDVFVEGANYRLFRMSGSKREKDFSDSLLLYSRAQKQARNKCGHPIKKPIRVLKFA